MTASSMETYCQVVPPMGLVHNSRMNLPIAATQTANPLPLPTTDAINRVKRNLFGNIKAGETDRLLRKEIQEKCDRMRLRYNFDMQKSLNQQQKNENTNSNSQAAAAQATQEPMRLPLLIEQEMEQHERRLLQEKTNLSRLENDLESTATMLEHNCVSDNSKCNKNTTTHMRRSVPVNGSPKTTTETNGQCSAERAKPYARQKLISECFNLRKTTNAKCKMPQRPLEVLELPKPIRASSSIQNTMTATTTSTSTSTSVQNNEETTISTTSSPLLLSVSISTSSLPSTDS